MSEWLLLLIALGGVVVVFWGAAELDRWRRHRRREHGLRRIYEEAQREVDENAGVDRLRRRNLW